MDHFIRTISARDWILGHPELQILAEITGVQIRIALEAYNTTTGCKMLHRYNTKEKNWIKVLRTLTGQCAMISNHITDTAEAPEPWS